MIDWLPPFVWSLEVLAGPIWSGHFTHGSPAYRPRKYETTFLGLRLANIGFRAGSDGFWSNRQGGLAAFGAF